MWQRIKNIYHLFVAMFANFYFGFPGRNLIVIGITGTDGKTTTVNLVYHILKTAGKTVSMVSTVGASINGEKIPLGFHITNPGPWQLQKFLHDASKSSSKEKYMVLEVSSHGLDQYRVWGIPFTIGVITNITPEHLDYHKTFDEYARAKIKLVQKAKIAILNRDASAYEKIRSSIPQGKIITFGLEKGDITRKTISFKSQLIGDFNKQNELAAIAVAKKLGLENVEIRKGLETFTTPSGRMNAVPNKRGIQIVVDYAHTANGIEQALKTLRGQTKKRLIAVVGGEGYRDEKKRPVIGRLIATIADIGIITAVDPRGLITEINQQILAGAEKAGGKVNKTIFVIADRQTAIKFAIDTAKKGDIIALLGKGHERSMNLDGKKEIPWSEFDAVKKALTSLSS